MKRTHKGDYEVKIKELSEALQKRKVVREE